MCHYLHGIYATVRHGKSPFPYFLILLFPAAFAPYIAATESKFSLPALQSQSSCSFTSEFATILKVTSSLIDLKFDVLNCNNILFPPLWGLIYRPQSGRLYCRVSLSDRYNAFIRIRQSHSVPTGLNESYPSFIAPRQKLFPVYLFTGKTKEMPASFIRFHSPFNCPAVNIS